MMMMLIVPLDNRGIVGVITLMMMMSMSMMMVSMMIMVMMIVPATISSLG